MWLFRSSELLDGQCFCFPSLTLLWCASKWLFLRQLTGILSWSWCENTRYWRQNYGQHLVLPYFFLRDLLSASAADFTFSFRQISVPGSFIHLVLLFCLIRLVGILLHNFMDFGNFLEIPANKVFCFKLKALSVYVTYFFVSFSLQVRRAWFSCSVLENW